jgi:hypothetical protein
MAYDSARGVTVLWGGGGQRLLGEWDGVAWTQLSGLPAPPDNGARMVFDSSRGLTVLAGGDTGNSGLFGTWERGSGWWTGVGLVGPAGRARSALAYDTRRNAAVMFGGVGNALFGDTWEYSCLGVRAESLNRLVCPGGRATLVARTPDDDTSPRTYQWRRGPLREVIPGANERAFTIDPVGPSQVGVYDCVVTTDCGVTTSGPVMVEVCVADFVCDGVLGFSDYAAFVDCFEQPDCARGDLNLDGVVDFFDYDDFVGAFEAGC